MKPSILNTILTFLIPLIFFKSTPTESKNILFYWGSSGYSHRISAWPLIEKLVENGHTITFISPYASKNSKFIPNVTDIVPENLARDIGLSSIDFVTLRLTDGVSAIDSLWDEYLYAGIRGCESLLKNPKVNAWIEKSSFDLVIINALYNDCGYGLAYKFKAPHVIYSTTSAFQWWGDAYGLPEENYPEFQYHFEVDMTFGQSVWNAIRPLYWQWRRYREVFPRIEGMLKKHLKNMEDLPSLFDIERNTSLIFVNTDFVEEYPRSLPPMVIRIGGIHCKNETKPLTKEVEDFIKAGDEGFIYLSFGTYATLASLPDWLQEIFISSMAKISKIQFIVKHDGEMKKELPKNVKLSKWISQQDVVAHPKIRAFICHGGLLGTQEAVYHGVPTIVIPLFAEQDYNAVRANARETGIRLEIKELTEEKLTDAITAILTNEKYRTNMKRLSDLFKDRPQKPIDTAVWWIEYALRNKDLSHLQPIGIHKNWFQKRMLDIWGFLAICFLIILSFLTFILYKCYKNVFILFSQVYYKKKMKSMDSNDAKKCN